MIITTVQFDRENQKTFSKLLQVYEHSVNLTMPDVPFYCEHLSAPDRDTGHPYNFTANSLKLKYWIDVIENCTEDIIFTDCDMLALKHARSAFDFNFDIAITFCDRGHKSPMNGGVVFARPTKRARDFMRLWLEINTRMYNDPGFHREWQRKYLGMNQAAFGYIYETEAHDCNILGLPTSIWNAIDSDWRHVNDDTVFLHIKSQLRKAVLMNMQPSGELYDAMTAWYDMRGRLPKPLPAPKRVKPVALTHRGVRRRGRARG